MKLKLSFLLVFFAFLSFAASAQTEGETKEKPAFWVPEQNIPVAEHYDGGKVAMYGFIAQEMKYPPMAKRNRIQGQCIVSFTLNEDGSLSNLKVLKNIGGGCGEEAQRIVSLLKFNAPGYNVNSSIPVNFKL